MLQGYKKILGNKACLHKLYIPTVFFLYIIAIVFDSSFHAFDMVHVQV